MGNNRPIRETSYPMPTNSRHPLAALLKTLQQRATHIVTVVDDALNSDNLRDRIWAVELLVKKLNPFDHLAKTTDATTSKPPSPKTIATMDDKALQAAIDRMLRGGKP